MIKEAIEKILDINKPELLTVNGREYSTKTLIPAREPEPETFLVNTLSGLVDYVEQNIDELDPKKLIIHVFSHQIVELHSALLPLFNQRLSYLRAVSDMPTFKFGEFHDVEEFIIKLQSQFVPTDSVSEILKIVGNLKESAVRTTTDDGITQTVAAKVGVAIVEDVDVPNPVTLQPYRTFLEIQQPESQFVLRLRGGKDGSLPTCALFEADGEKWRLEAIRRIYDWLEESLPDMAIIA